MKFAIRPLLFIAATAAAQVPKPPVGVPADAKHFNGKWYKVVPDKVPWHTAKQKAAAMRGQLAVVPDEATWDFLKNLTPASVWLGATDEKTEGVWEWADGTPFKFTAWWDKQPDNTSGEEHYIATWEKKWNDVPKSGAFGQYKVTGYIVEWRDK